jgi:hypothetical protein
LEVKVGDEAGADQTDPQCVDGCSTVHSFPPVSPRPTRRALVLHSIEKQLAH